METHVASVVAEARATRRGGPRGRTARRSGGGRWSRRIVPYVFLFPFLLIFLTFFLLPFLYAMSQSIYKEQRSGLGLAPPKIVGVGLENYGKALHDPLFWDGIHRVVVFGAVQIPVMMLIALVLALLMDSAVIRLRRFFRLAAFLPYAVPGVIAVIMWGYFYSPSFSPIRQSFELLGLSPPDLLSPRTVLWSIANISTWEFAGYNMVIFFSALQSIPQEIYEAGRLDGLSEIGIALRLKLPMILPALMLGVLFSLVGTLQLFNEPLILSRLSGAITTSYTPNIYAYSKAFVDTNYYYGGALAVIMGLITFAFSFGFLRLTRRQSGV